MAEFSDYLESAILNATLRNTSYTSPATVYVALHSADPTDDGSGAELANSNGYARQAATFAAPSGGACATSADITFTASGGAWSTATHIGIWDSATHGGGNLLYHSALDASKTAGDGDSIVISAGNLTVTLA